MTCTLITVVLSAVLAIGLSTPCSAQALGIVTWLHPSAEGIYTVESAVAGVHARVAGPDGAEVRNPESLRAAGWEWSGDGFWQTPRRAGGGRLSISITGLPAGSHQVFLRYFSQPRVPGNEWWFILQCGLEDGREVRGSLDHNANRIIAGVGGHDPRTVCESRIGIVGREEQPVTGLNLWFQRYQWSELARVGSIRIETDPSMHYATTGEANPVNDRIRAALLANGPQVDDKAAYGLAVVSGTLKVRPKSFAALEGQALPAEVDLAAARGEYESRQVILHSPERGLGGVRLECSPLVADDGATIPVEELLFAPVGYVPYRVPTDLSVHGYWPEPILTFLDEFTVRRGDVQSLWYRVHVPRDARAGVYRGTLSISADDAPACTIPVTLRVWDFTLPEMPHLRVVVGCNQPGPFEMSYGLNPSTIYGFNEGWLEEMSAWARAGATGINLGYIWGKQLDQETRLPTGQQLDEWVAQIRTRYEAATEAGLRDACYLYMFDEATGEWHPAMRVIAERLRAEFPDLLLLTTAHDPSFGADTGLDAIDGWCPLTMHYRPDTAAAARRRGKQVWWYTCNSPQKPFANLLMTHPAIDARLLMGFMAFAYQTDGFLYYATSGGYYANMPAITEGPYTQWAVVDNAHDHLYQKGPDGPLPSLRLEAMRDGLEDYDYLYLAYAARADLEAADVSSPELERLAGEIRPYFAPGSELVKSLVEYGQCPAQLENVRRRLGAYVEEALRAGAGQRRVRWDRQSLAKPARPPHRSRDAVSCVSPLAAGVVVSRPGTSCPRARRSHAAARWLSPSGPGGRDVARGPERVPHASSSGPIPARGAAGSPR